MFEKWGSQLCSFLALMILACTILKKHCAHCISDEVKKGSVAAGAICMWIHSVYKYAEIYNQVAPKLAKLMGAEEQVNKVRNEEEFG